ncbi:MAG: hypothetical protein FJ104_12960, partial [Deltaproteobacteria bacterium]|nr:hypothetical protein [Deltaproteobacteria bacterium]
MHLFLAGPPGIGKSTVAPLLAELLGASVVELDRVVARAAHKEPGAVIRDEGMERFRDLESAALDRLEATPAWIVVDCGGGAVIRDANRARMRRLGVILGLSGSRATVRRGIERTMGKRVHLAETPAEHAVRVLRERRAAYRDADAHFVVDRATPQEVARAIAAWLVASRGFRTEVDASSRYPIVVRAGLLDQVGGEL